MIDYVKIKVRAGKGGDGHVSFLRQKGKPFGIPEGGDGGDGGDVFIVPSNDVSTLSDYRFKKEFTAASGANGGRNNKTGAKGEDLFLEVPLGTLIKDEKGEVIFDIIKMDDKILVAKGGKGGRGNIHLRHEIKERRSQGEKGLIKAFEPGQEGEEAFLTLELKVLADVGLVGLPNAGKSTLLSKLTAAKPKVASYPFTTLEPNLGVMNFRNKEIVIADIPGLIEGASTGKGLGDQFLRHLERTRLLVHLVSLEAGDPLRDFETINEELFSYSERFKEMPMIVALSKKDLVDKEKAERIQKEFKKKAKKVFLISSFTGEGLGSLQKEIVRSL
jgi:GTP-binding protein